jgi:hypothetical protein
MREVAPFSSHLVPEGRDSPRRRQRWRNANPAEPPDWTKGPLPRYCCDLNPLTHVLKPAGRKR